MTRAIAVGLASVTLHALAFAMLTGGHAPRVQSDPTMRAEMAPAPELEEVAFVSPAPAPPGPECPTAPPAATVGRAPSPTRATSSSRSTPTAQSSAPPAAASPMQSQGAPVPLVSAEAPGDWISGLGLEPGAGAALLDGLGGGGGRGSSRPPGLSETEWTCPWPASADRAGVDHAIVHMTVRVALDGRPSAPELVDDPGFGFGVAALRCSLEHVYRAGRGANGKPFAARTPPFQVHFDRTWSAP